MSKQYTNEEIRIQFINHLKMLVDYWDSLPNKSSKQKLEGFLHSTLVTIDGGCGGMCGFQLIPSVHPSDKEYCIKNNKDYYPCPKQSKYDIREDCEMHDLLYTSKTT